MARTASAGSAARAGRRPPGTHAAAGCPFFSAALEPKRRHLPLYFRGIAFRAAHGFITFENKLFKGLTTITAHKLEDGHLFPPCGMAQQSTPSAGKAAIPCVPMNIDLSKFCQESF